MTNIANLCHNIRTMSTINISLPEAQVGLVDGWVARYGFANRSEFIRALLRFVSGKQEVIETAVSYPFIMSSERSVKKIISGFSKTGKYSADFLADLREGLTQSSYFKD